MQVEHLPLFCCEYGVANCRRDLRRKNLGREERYRTVISGMEPRRIAVVMLLPRWTIGKAGAPSYFNEQDVSSPESP